jgi:hypothetical protein
MMMNRQGYIDKYVGDFDIGDKVEFIRNSPREYKTPVTAIIKDIFHCYSIKFTLDCTDADDRRFEFYNASLSYLKKVA